MSGYIPLFAVVAGFTFTAVSGLYFIPFLRRLKYGQTILDIGPKWHKSKEGTPVMGGLMFILGTVLAVSIALYLSTILASGSNITKELKSQNRLIRLIAGILLALGMAFIGFIDDYIKVVKKRNLGLRAREKTFFQLLVATGYLAALSLSGMNTTKIPFFDPIDITSGAGLLFWPIALIFIYGFTNAVNLTDGVDGLATTVTMIVAVFYMLATGVLGFYGQNVFASALAGACIGFLIWNFHPAKVFMGDTGSMFLGGAVVALSFGIDMPILLFLSGILYLLEALSVVIQVTYYKRTKKRIFKMSPIHHHFEMCGWSEQRIVVTFSLVALIGCALAFLPILFSW